MFDSRSARISASLALVAAVLLLGGSLIVTSGSEATAPSIEAAAAPSYSALRPILRQGAGKEEEKGELEVFQFHNPDPAAWIKVITNPVTGESQVWIVKHVSYEEAGDDEIPTTYESIEGPTPQSLDGFVAWIVDTYDHVENSGQLAPEPLD